MAEERYALLVNLGKKITDYSIDKDAIGDGKIYCYKIIIFEIATLRFWTNTYYSLNNQKLSKQKEATIQNSSLYGPYSCILR